MKQNTDTTKWNYWYTAVIATLLLLIAFFIWFTKHFS